MIDLSNLTKVYYTIGEVSEIFNIAPSQLRYWESEFKQLNPGKNNRGERKYTRKEIEIIDQIQHLLKDKGFTIDGAKKELIHQKSDKKDNEEMLKKLHQLKKTLVALKEML